MDFKKNKKMVILFGATALICIILLAFSSQMKKKQAATKSKANMEKTQQSEENSMKAAWDEIDKAQSLIDDKDDFSQQKTIDILANEDADISKLSIYPSPSYVSEEEDTVIYKKGIYKRVGFVKEKPKVQDTIIVDGKAYVLAE